MKRPPQQIRINYFGKIPARSDFIKAADNIVLVSLLDQWLAEVMNLLSADARWKLNYDALRPLQFAFVGTRSKRAIAGRIVASGDESQRRYPFLTMSAVEIDDADAFVPLSTLVLSGLWQAFDTLSAPVLADADPAQSLQLLAASTVEVEPDGACHEEVFITFLEGHTLAQLQTMLEHGQFDGALRQVMLGLALLLLPVRDNASAPLEKSLVLPLPRDAAMRCAVAAFWLHLIVPFVRHADFELALFLAEIAGAPVLVVGFGGAAPQTLQAIIDPALSEEQQVGFGQLDWVDEALAGIHGAQQLSACLGQPQLSLRAALQLFQQTFA